jgi:hypothetical protein
MESIGINTGLLLIQLIPVIVIVGFPIITLFDLKKKKLGDTTLAIWVLIICAIPVIGSLAYWIIKPSSEIK